MRKTQTSHIKMINWVEFELIISKMRQEAVKCEAIKDGKEETVKSL